MKAFITDPGTLNAILSIAALIITAIWSRIKVSDWYRNRQNELIDICVEHIEHSVGVVYEKTVRKIKMDLPGDPARKLTDVERESTTQDAIAIAVETAKEQGIDLLKTLGPVLAVNIVKQVVAEKKQAPASVVGMLP